MDNGSRNANFKLPWDAFGLRSLCPEVECKKPHLSPHQIVSLNKKKWRNLDANDDNW